MGKLGLFKENQNLKKKNLQNGVWQNYFSISKIKKKHESER